MKGSELIIKCQTRQELAKKRKTKEKKRKEKQEVEMQTLSLYDLVIPDCNMLIEKCERGSPERNATLLCAQVDFVFRHAYFPMPRELFNYLEIQNGAGIVKETTKRLKAERRQTKRVWKKLQSSRWSITHDKSRVHD